jgi:hypothetical protein
MPWDSYLRSSNSNSVDSLKEEDDDGKNYPVDAPSQKFMELPDSKDTFVGQQSERDAKSSFSQNARNRGRYETQEEVDSRLQLIARDACPLFDRFGRILTDVSPHLWSRAMPGINRPSPANRFDPFQSLESRLLSLLRERPPSPSPLQTFRAPITSVVPRMEPLDVLRSGLLRNAFSSANNGNSEDSDGSNAQRPSSFSESTRSSSNISTAGSTVVPPSGAAARRTTSSSSPSGNGLEHHVDIHIAILSPQNGTLSSGRPVDSLSRTVASLTASLQAQAQQLAARTQELSERTSAVSEITSAITEAIRASVRDQNTSASNPSSTSQAEQSEGNQSSDEEETDGNGARNSEVPEEEESEERLDMEDIEEGDVHDDHPSVVCEFTQSRDHRDVPHLENEDTLRDLSVGRSCSSEYHDNAQGASLMPNSAEEDESLPFWNVADGKRSRHEANDSTNSEIVRKEESVPSLANDDGENSPSLLSPSRNDPGHDILILLLLPHFCP